VGDVTTIRESSLEERQRQDREKAEDIRKRQIRLGDISDPDATEETEETENEEETPKPKSKPRGRAKKSETE